MAIGGLSRQAEARLQRGAAGAAAEPVVATATGAPFTLTPRAAGVTLDIGGTVEKALARSRQGNLFSRRGANCARRPLAAA